MKAEYEGVLRLLVLFKSKFGAQFGNISRLKWGSADRKVGQRPAERPRGADRRPSGRREASSP